MVKLEVALIDAQVDAQVEHHSNCGRPAKFDARV
jgi:hypothetical protein